MEQEFLNFNLEIFIQVNGKMIYFMDKEYIYQLQVKDIKGNSQMEIEKEKVHFITQTEMYLKETI